MRTESSPTETSTKIAKALGLAVPANLQARADEVIECPLMAHRVILLRLHKAIGIGANRTSIAVYEYTA